VLAREAGAGHDAVEHIEVGEEVEGGAAELLVVDKEIAACGRPDHPPLHLHHLLVLVEGGETVHRRARHEREIGPQPGEIVLGDDAEEAVELLGERAAERDQGDGGIARQRFDDGKVVGDHRERAAGGKVRREKLRGRPVVDHHAHARFHERGRRLGDAALLVDRAALAVAKVALELGARLDGGAAADLAQEAGALKVVEIAVDRHLGDAEALRQGVERGRALAHQDLDDPLPSVLELHAPSGRAITATVSDLTALT